MFLIIIINYKICIIEWTDEISNGDKIQGGDWHPDYSNISNVCLLNLRRNNKKNCGYLYQNKCAN